MKKEFIAPILALSLICLMMAGALSLINNVTEPIITAAAAERAEQARKDIIPMAHDFVLIESDDLPPNVIYAHKAVARGDVIGYTFIVNTKSFGGDMRIIVGIDAEGRIIKSSVLAHSDTVGFIARVISVSDEAEERGSSLLDADAVSNATVSFNAYKRALETAAAAFEIVRGLG
jgi:electron transport complex protein RnfG